MDVILVAGARPNFVKVAPILRSLEKHDVNVMLVHTGQHYDDAMSTAFFRDLGIRDPDANLEVGSGSHAAQTAAVMQHFEPLARSRAWDAIVVVGDVNSTLACALVAAKAAIPVAHVEAGLRSRNRLMPEEVNRLCTDVLSDWLLTPSADADENLRAEGFPDSRIFRVGNVMIDSLLYAKTNSDVMTIGTFSLDRSFTLATLHRPENVDDPSVLEGLIGALAEIAREQPVLFPVHPRTAARVADLGLPGLTVTGPLGYLDFCAAMDRAEVVVTDSGGVQEETTVLGVPCLTVRPTTERPITVSQGTNRVVGTRARDIVAAWREADRRRAPFQPEGWDGRAADRVAEVLTTVTPPLAGERRA